MKWIKLFNKDEKPHSVVLYVEDISGSVKKINGCLCGLGLRYFHKGRSLRDDEWWSVCYYSQRFGFRLIYLCDYFDGLYGDELVSEVESYNKIQTEEELDEWLEERIGVLNELYSDHYALLHYIQEVH